MMYKIVGLIISIYMYVGFVKAQDTLSIKWGNPHYLNLIYEKDEVGNIIDSTYHFKDTLPNGFYKLFHKNTILAEQGEFKNSLKHGEWAYWKSDGTLHSIEHYKNGQLDGSKKVFWPNTLIKESLNYKNGKQVGHQLKIDQAGKMWSKTVLDENGNGTYRIWDPNQSTVTTGKLKNWMKHGDRTMKSTIDGKLIRKDYWENGKLTRKRN